MKHDEYHRQFAEGIIEQIRQGTAPWQKPWGPGERVLPANVDTGRSYSGGNSLHLAAVQQERGYGDVRWGTYRQIQARGGQVRKGERGTRILSFQDHRKIAVNDERGRPVRDNEGKRVYRHERLPTPVVRQYTVFNAEQADGLPARPTPTAEPLWKVHQQAERVLEDGGVPVRHVAGDRAFYNLNNDEIVLPERGQFPSANHYYQTALHELGHSTGHPERMNRATLTQGIADGFGSPAYAKEELRAEISAMMTGERVGVGHDPSRGAAYVEGWVAALEEDPREIRRAAADAQKISDFVLARSREREPEREPRWPPPALPTRSTPQGRSSRCRSRPGAPAPAAEAKDGALGDVRPHDRTGPASRRAAKPRYLPHAGRPSPRIRREPGPRVHLLQRTVPWGARRHRHLRRRLVRDLAEAHFGGHPYTTRRAVNAWTREGLAKESTAKGPKGRPFKVLTLTRKGAAAIRDLDAGQGLDPGQHIRSAARLLQHAQLAHDTAIYRACGRERQRLLERGAAIRRVRLDGELKSAVARRSESARARDGRRAADAERHRAAGELGLPIDAQGRVLYPDAQIEYTDAEGRSGRVNVEVASGHYRQGSVRAKAAAGFRMHANGPAGARVLRALGCEDHGSSLRGPAERDPAAIEL